MKGRCRFWTDRSNGPSASNTHIAGTPGYMAVEAFQPSGVDERGDQFSFCVTLHEALHGSRPFSAQAFDELVAEVRRGPAHGGMRDVPVRLSHVVRRGLAWDASHPADGWNEPELVDAGHLVTGAPATTIQRGAMHIIARGSNNAVHHWWKDTTWHWEATAGTFSSDPDVVPFGHQLQTIGRGMDGHLYTVWYDPMTRVWTRENHGIPVAE